MLNSNPIKVKSERSDDANFSSRDDSEQPELLSDPEDYLEQNESLDMNLTNGNQKIWLVKLPRYLASKWTNNEALMGKNLGRVKIKQNKNAVGGNKLQVKLVLNDSPIYQDIPKEYDIAMLNTQVRNSYVFSEENLKRFKAENTELSADAPVEKEDDDFEDGPRNTYNVFKNTDSDGSKVKKIVPFVKTIPKKTTLYGKIYHDCQIRPASSDKKYNQFLIERSSIQPLKARPKVVLLDEIPGVIQSNAAPSIRGGKNTSIFMRSHITKKRDEGRAIRMPEKDLLDILFRLFEEYDYWSIKGLRERTRQPESYLKETVESIANLIKKGPYTGKYNLKPAYKKLRDAERAARAGLDINDKTNDNNDDDDDEDMEDVL